jgi:hypothetical protein
MALASQAGVTFTASKSPNWDKLTNRYKSVNGSAELVKTGLIKWTMAEGVMVARDQMDQAIYHTPLPPGGVRTGLTREAVVMRPGFGVGGRGDFGSIAVDIARFQTYYPRFVEDGTSRMAARHFWRNTRTLMAARFAAQGRQALKTLKMNLIVR